MVRNAQIFLTALSRAFPTATKKSMSSIICLIAACRIYSAEAVREINILKEQDIINIKLRLQAPFVKLNR